jgi:pimeloyl-ACP methyl ester carboxylesterase
VSPLPDDGAWGFAFSEPVDGFRLRYVRRGAGRPVLLLHGWPGSWWDCHRVLERLEGGFDVVVPDLRGFGGSDRHDRDPREAYGREAQASSVLGLLDELGLDRVLVHGYDVGSRVAQAVARAAPGRIAGLVVAPPFPSFGHRPTGREAQAEFWYQHFHRLPLSEELLDGNPGAVRAYLEHFWRHWGGGRDLLRPEELDALAALYARPGAFRASIAWYRAGAGATSQPAVPEEPPLTLPVIALCGTRDPLFPLAWADALELDFADVERRVLEDVSHFVPFEAPDAVAAAVRDLAQRAP